MKAFYVDSYFERSESMRWQGSRASINSFLKDGYSVKMNKNGNWLLAKPAHAWFIFKTPTGQDFRVDLRQQIMTHYGKQRFYEATYKRFVKDLTNGVVRVELDTDNNCVIIWLHTKVYPKLFRIRLFCFLD